MHIDLDCTTVSTSERTISLDMIADEIDRAANNLYNSVTTFKRHPTYDSRANLLARANELSGMFHLALKLNGYNEFSAQTRQRVQAAREAVESLYKAKPIT
ncbi:hypothetical protein HWB99_gp055 [Mycobacterium phage DrLupo]|uniref:Uncharacterized protein n=1 Tax=Mycobacterium phage DrLupo TaxID=2499037 RepID=A0A3S9UQM5_9CAUD|nr:hypothetical protein HWB99_gp055 [Mycobacterium phage DrLupo]AZS12591.1 hypothetical protein SEA_DRLUPO_55 [Mycobacterium phage DrLupo]